MTPDTNAFQPSGRFPMPYLIILCLVFILAMMATCVIA